jgi:hypothetical protein
MFHYKPNGDEVWGRGGTAASMVGVTCWPLYPPSPTKTHILAVLLSPSTASQACPLSFRLWPAERQAGHEELTVAQLVKTGPKRPIALFVGPM